MLINKATKSRHILEPWSRRSWTWTSWCVYKNSSFSTPRTTSLDILNSSSSRLVPNLESSSKRSKTLFFYFRNPYKKLPFTIQRSKTKYAVSRRCLPTGADVRSLDTKRFENLSEYTSTCSWPFPFQHPNANISTNIYLYCTFCIKK